MVRFDERASALAVLAIAAALVASAGCPGFEDLPAGDMKSPQYWGDAFLAKPFTSDELLRAIAALGARRGRRPRSPTPR